MKQNIGLWHTNIQIYNKNSNYKIGGFSSFCCHLVVVFMTGCFCKNVLSTCTGGEGGGKSRYTLIKYTETE